MPNETGGSALTSFSLYINDGDDSNEATTQVSSYNTNSLLHTLTDSTDGLVTNKIYKLRFVATNAISNSEYSDTVRYAAVDAPSAPGTPSILASLTSETQLAFEWTAPTLASGQEIGQAITGYLVYVQELNQETSPTLSIT